MWMFTNSVVELGHLHLIERVTLIVSTNILKDQIEQISKFYFGHLDSYQHFNAQIWANANSAINVYL